MVIGGMRQTLIKGMVMIICITTIPSLWPLISHLDDKLYEAVYDIHFCFDPFNMILLDTASTIFQLAIIYVPFHIVSLTGGGDASGTLSSSDSSTKSYSQQIGRTGGSMNVSFELAETKYELSVITQERKGTKGIIGGFGSKWTRGLGGWSKKRK